MQCEEWADANSELFKEAHDETVHKNSYKRKLYELISASLVIYLIPAMLPYIRLLPGHMAKMNINKKAITGDEMKWMAQFMDEMYKEVKGE